MNLIGTARLVQTLSQLLEKLYPPSEDSKAEDKEIYERYVLVEKSEADLKEFDREKPILVKTHLPFHLVQKLVEQNREDSGGHAQCEGLPSILLPFLQDCHASWLLQGKLGGVF